VAAAVEQLHPDVRFVSEIGGEDMKTIFFTESGEGTSKQVYMQSACSGGTGTFVEKTARKLRISPEDLAAMPYDGMSLHKVSSKCGIFAETDANTLLKGGVPVAEIIASLFEAVVYQNLATLTKGNTPTPEVLLLGGPNCSSRACSRRGGTIWTRSGRSAGLNCRRVGRSRTASWSPKTRSITPRSAASRSARARATGSASIPAPRSCAGGSTKASTKPRPRKAARRSPPARTISAASRRNMPRKGRVPRRRPSSARFPNPRPCSSAATSARPPPRPW